MQIIGVRGDFHQATLLHFAYLRPAHKSAARQLAVAIGDAAARRRVEPAGHHGKHGRILISLEQRKHEPVKALVAIVKCEQHGLFRQAAAAGAGIFHLLPAHRRVAVGFEPVEMRHQLLHRDGLRKILALHLADKHLLAARQALRAFIHHIVVAQSAKADIVGADIGCTGHTGQQHAHKRYQE